MSDRTPVNNLLGEAIVPPPIVETPVEASVIQLPPAPRSGRDAGFSNLPMAPLDEGSPAPPPVSEAGVARHQTRVAQANPRDALAAAVTRYTGAGAATQTQEQVDLGSMQIHELEARYGANRAAAMIRANLSGQREYSRLEGTERTTEQVLSDVARDIPGGFASSLGSIAALGAGIVSPTAGTVVSGAVDGFNDWLRGNQSYALQNRGRIGEIRSELTERDNEARRERELADGVSPFQAGLRHIGRGILDGLTNTVADNTRLTSGISQGIGSLFAGGVVGRTVGAAGAVLPGLAGRAIAGAAMPIGIGIQEGAGAYQQTVSEVMAMTPESLERNSPAYRELIEEGKTPEEARTWLANRAGQMAAAVVAPIAGGTGAAIQGLAGRIVGRPLAYLEEAPLRVGSLRGAGAQIGGEFLEEGYQGGVSALAGNAVIQNTADETRTLTANVGAQIGEGALTGLGTAGVVQAPGVAGRGAAAIGNAVVGAATDTIERVADARLERTEAASPASSEVVRARAEAALAPAAPEVATAVEALPVEQQPAVRSYLDRLESSLRYDAPSMVPVEASEPVRSALVGSTTRSAAIDSLSNLIVKTKDENTLVEAVNEMRRLLTEHSANVNSDAASLDALPDANPIIQRINSFQDALGVLENNPRLLRAQARADEILLARTKAPVAAPTSATAQELVSLVQTDPTAANPETLKNIAYQITKNGLVLTPAQKQAYDIAVGMIQYMDKAVKAKAGFGHTDSMRDVNQEILNTEKSGNLGVHAKSVKRHARDILQAANAGDRKDAKNLLEDMGLFVQHQNNKLAALNEAARTGKQVTYQALNPRNEWYTAEKPMGVSLNQGSVQFAQQVYAETLRLTGVYNTLVEVLSDLNGSKIELTPLLEALDAPTAQAIENLKIIRSVQTKTTEPTSESVSEPTAEPVVEKTPQASETPTASTPTEAPVPNDPTNTKNLFPNLIGSLTEIRNLIFEAFSVPETPTSNFTGQPSPVEYVQDMLKTGKHISSRIQTNGKTSQEGYQELLGMIPEIKNKLNAQLAKFMGKTTGGKTRLEKLAEGIGTLQNNGRVLNLLTEDGTYDDNLMEGAILAGLQWLVSVEKMQAPWDAERAAKLLGKEEHEVSGPELDALNTGILTNDMLQSVSSAIGQFWGLKTNKDAPIGYSQGVLESTAGEVLRAFLNAGLLTQLDPIELLNGEGRQTTYNLFKPSLDEDLRKAVDMAPTLIEEIALIDREQVLYLGEGSAPTKAPTHQLRNPMVPNTPEDKKSILHASKTPFKANKHMALFYELLNVTDIQKLFGPQIKATNIQHKKSTDGQLTMLAGAHASIMATLAQLQAMDPDFQNVPMYFGHNVTTVGRLQMLGAYNPQANKLVREVFHSAWSTIDLTKDEDIKLFRIGLAQALEIKVHKKSYAAIDAELTKVLSSLEGAIELLQNMQKEEALPDSAVEVFLNTFKGKAVTPLAIHALSEYARSLTADTPSAFETSVYVEADGVTNGIANAMMLLTSGDFTPNQMDNLARVGYSVDPNVKSLNDRHAKGGDFSLDMYNIGATNTQMRIAKMLADTKDPIVRQQMQDVYKLLTIMFKGDIDFNDKDELVIGRSTLKNPMTITLYGSGAKGIAGNLVNEMLAAIYEGLSVIDQGGTMFSDPKTGTNFVRLVEKLTGSALISTPKTGIFVAKKAQDAVNLRTVDPQKFTFTPEQFNNLINNVLIAFVNPMREGITDTVGESLMQNITMVRQAVQVQSIVLEQKFKEALNAELAKQSRSASAFLSPNEMANVLASLKKYAPLIFAPGQAFYISAKTRNAVMLNKDGEPMNVYFGGALDDTLSIPGQINSPGDAGVGGIPFLNIGMGDGKTIQNLTTRDDAPEGATFIFDGVNFKLSTLQSDSRKANEAVWDAWQGNTPLAVYQSFRQFVSALDPSDFTDQAMLKKINRALNIEATSGAEIVSRLGTLNTNLGNTARSIEARHTVLRAVQAHVDQMASAESPHMVPGTVIEGDVVAYLNEKLHEAEKSLPLVIAVGPKVKTLTPTGVITPDTFESVRKGLKLSAEQRKLYDLALPYLKTMGYRVFIGSPQEIQAFQRKFGLDEIAMRSDGKNIHGATHTGNKMIYLVDASAETLVHEMVHGATLETLIAHYDGRSTGVTKDAVARLEKLMEQFVSKEMRNDFTLSDFETAEAYQNAVNQIRDAQENPALMLNEFMAWTLANQKLAKKASTFSITTLVKNALMAIRKLVWKDGRKGPQVQDDKMLSSLRFDSAVLMAQNPQFMAEVSGQVAYMATTPGSSPRLNDLSRTFTNFFSKYLDRAPNPAERRLRETAFHAELLKIQKLTAIASGWFELDANQSALMEQIVATLATDMITDPTTLTEMNRVYRHVLAHLTPESFRQNPGVVDAADQTRAQAMYDVLTGVAYKSMDYSGRSSLLPVFMALGTVSEPFRDVLSKIPPMESATSDTRTVDTWIEDKATAMMDHLSSFYAGSTNTSVILGFDSLMNNLRDQASKKAMLIEQGMAPLGDAIAKGNEHFMAIGDALHEKALTLNPKSQWGRIVADAVKLVTSTMSEKHHEAGGESILSLTNRMDAMAANPLRDMMSALVGRTKSNLAVYDLIKIVKTFAQQARQQFRENLPSALARNFTEKPTEDQWSAMFRAVGNTDILSLLANNDRDALMHLLSHSSRTNARIAQLEASLAASYGPDAWNIVQQKSQQLAGFMMTKSTGGRNLLRNADAISMLLNTRVKHPAPTPEMVNEIDQLVSLYAWQQVKQTDRDAMRMLFRTEKKGMSIILAYMATKRQDERTKAIGMGRFNALKGYVPSEQTSGLNLIVANDSEFTKLSQMSYVRIGDYNNSLAEPSRTKRGYYFAPVNGRAPYNQGIVQNVKPSSGGVDLSSGVSTNGQHAGVILDPKAVSHIISNWSRETGTNENLIPIMDQTGKIVGFERALDPVMQERLQGDTNLARMIGVWAGRQAEEIAAHTINQQVVLRLHDMWKDAKSTKSENDYTNLWLSKDPVIIDGLKLLSQEMIDEINDKFGADGFMVRKDMINDALGYREASVGDVWKGNSRWSPKTQKIVKEVLMTFGGNEAYKYFVNGEEILQSAVTNVKLIIVVKSVVVPMANMVSNIGQLLVRGVNPLFIGREMPRKLNELHSYNTTRMELQDLEIQRAVATDPYEQNRLGARMEAIRDGWTRLSIWPLLARGEYSQISDAGATREELMLSRGKLDQFIETQVNKLPDKVVAVGRQLLITKETALFQGLQKAMAYGDFLGKAVLYEHMIRKGVPQNEALGIISEEFINYDRLPGRFRGYLEKNGLLWFWTYKIGATKVAMSILRKNPVQALFAIAAPIPSFLGSVDLPLNENLGAKIMDGSINWSIGPSQGLSGPGLHPLWNVMN